MNSRPSGRPGVTRAHTKRAGGATQRPSASSGRSAARRSIPATSRLRFSGSAQEADRDHDRDDHADGDPEQERALAGGSGRRVEALRGEVADQHEGRRPEPGAQHAEREVVAVPHPRAARHERRQGPDQPDEAPDHDRLAPVAGEVVLDPGEALVRDPHLRAVAQEELPPQPAAEQEAHRVARQRADPDDPDRQHDRGLALSGDRATEDHHRLAREHQPDEGAGLEERPEPDEDVGEAAQLRGDVLERLLEVDVREHPVEGHEAAPTITATDDRSWSRLRAALAARRRSRSSARLGRRHDRVRMARRQRLGRPVGGDDVLEQPEGRGPRPGDQRHLRPGLLERRERRGDLGPHRQRRPAQVVDQQLGVVERRRAATGGGAQPLGDRIQLRQVAAQAQAVGLRVDLGGAQAVLGRAGARRRTRPAAAAAPPPRRPRRPGRTRGRAARGRRPRGRRRARRPRPPRRAPGAAAPRRRRCRRRARPPRECASRSPPSPASAASHGREAPSAPPAARFGPSTPGQITWSASASVTTIRSASVSGQNSERISCRPSRGGGPGRGRG